MIQKQKPPYTGGFFIKRVFIYFYLDEELAIDLLGYDLFLLGVFLVERIEGLLCARLDFFFGRNFFLILTTVVFDTLYSFANTSIVFFDCAISFFTSSGR